MSSDDFVVTGDFYEGSYGPTVLLFLPSLEAVIWLRDAFSKQIGNAFDQDLLLDPNFKVDHLTGLILRNHVSPNDIETRRLTQEDPPSVGIYATDRGWRQLADLLEPFASGTPGHQYFGDDDGDEVLFEVSFCEDTGRNVTSVTS